MEYVLVYECRMCGALLFRNRLTDPSLEKLKTVMKERQPAEMHDCSESGYEKVQYGQAEFVGIVSVKKARRDGRLV